MAQVSYYPHLLSDLSFNYMGHAFSQHGLEYPCRYPADYEMTVSVCKDEDFSEQTTRGNSPPFGERGQRSLLNSAKDSSQSPISSLNSKAEVFYGNHFTQTKHDLLENHQSRLQMCRKHLDFERMASQDNKVDHGKNYHSNRKESCGEETKVKFKTELCRNYEMEGHCKFGSKCSFAHGRDELQNKKHINLHYKSKKCNKFFDQGFCEYGSRCQYLHKEDSFSHILDSYCEKLLVWMERNPNLDMSSIMKKTHSFGKRNSFFERLEKQGSTESNQQQPIV